MRMQINIRDPDVDYDQLISPTGECSDYGFLIKRDNDVSDLFKYVNRKIDSLNGGAGVLAEAMDNFDFRRETVEDNYVKQLSICAESLGVFLQYANTVDKKIAAKIRVDTYEFQNTFEWAHPDFGKSFFDKAIEAIAESPAPLKIFLAGAVLTILGVGTAVAGPASAPMWAAAFKGAVILGAVGTTAGAVYGGVTEGAEGAYKYGTNGLFLGTTLGAGTGLSFAVTRGLAAGGGFMSSTLGSNLGGLLVRTATGLSVSFVDEAIDPVVKDDRFSRQFAANTIIGTTIGVGVDMIGLGTYYRLGVKGFTSYSLTAPKVAPNVPFSLRNVPMTDTMTNEGIARLVLGDKFKYTVTVNKYTVPMPWVVDPMENLGKFTYGVMMPSAGTTAGRIATTDDPGLKDIPDIFVFKPMMINRETKENK